MKYMNVLIIGLVLSIILLSGCTETSETDKEIDSVEKTNEVVENTSSNDVISNDSNIVSNEVDLTECENAKSDDKFFCYQRKAIEYDDPLICENLLGQGRDIAPDEQRDGCLAHYATSVNDSSICDIINEGPYKSSCINYFEE